MGSWRVLFCLLVLVAKCSAWYDDIYALYNEEDLCDQDAELGSSCDNGTGICGHPYRQGMNRQGCSYTCHRGQPCIPLPCFSNGNWTLDTDENILSATATAVCDTGYQTQGTVQLTCGRYRQWEPEICEPCQPVECSGALPPLTHGEMIPLSDPSTYNTLAVGICSDGYIPSTPLILSVCLANGTWSLVTDYCYKICCDPQDLPDGYVSQGDNCVGTIAELQCDGPEYALEGSSQVFCGPNGNWTPSAGQCVEVCCPEPCIENGYLDENDSVHCNQGYELNESFTDVECDLATMTWPYPIDACLLIHCLEEDLPLVPNTNQQLLAGSTNYEPGTVVLYTCDNDTYRNPNPPITSTCLLGGQWSQPTGSCELIVCLPDSLPQKENGSFMSLGNDVYGSASQLQCDEGFTLCGEGIVYCNYDGTWDKSDAECVYDYECECDEDCEDPYTVCEDGFCVCQPGYQCVNDTCIPEFDCVIDEECPPYEVCEAPGYCVCGPGSQDVDDTCYPDSCFVVYDVTENPANGEYILNNGLGETYLVYCEFKPNCIYTYVARTDLDQINIEDLYTNKREILIRHKRTDGEQYEVTFGQPSMFYFNDMFIQYNSNPGYNDTQNQAMGPYLYVALWEISGVVKHDDYGFQINGDDCIFNNCDGNQNSYFALLFNANNEPTTGRGVIRQNFISKWKTQAVQVAPDRYLDDEFFAQYEKHFGGCGGYICSGHLNDVIGVTFGLCYELIYSSCVDVYNQHSNPPDGKYLIDNGAGDTYVVYCEFLVDRIYTYVARTNLAYINIDDLYNNRQEILVRHKRTDGIQYEVRYGQISNFSDVDMSIQYNNHTGYNPIHNPTLDPYIYVGLLEIDDVIKHDDNGYRTNDDNWVFRNCDGNQNNYFALLFNANNNPTTGRGPGPSHHKVFMSHWITEAQAVLLSRYLDDEFFVQWEMHMGGCGGFGTSDHHNDVIGVTFGLRYGEVYLR